MKIDQHSRTKGVHGKFIVYGLLCLAAIALAPYCIVVLFKPAWKALVEHPIKDAGNTLLVTAHPDDETVFFGPTITALHSDGHEVFLLCLTTGKAESTICCRILWPVQASRCGLIVVE